MTYGKWSFRRPLQQTPCQYDDDDDDDKFY